jgi:hypothetical protein
MTVVTLLSCGGSDPAGLPATPPGTYTVAVTATAGSGASALEKTTELTLTVRP